jgi:preprotein translocase subunit SecG
MLSIAFGLLLIVSLLLIGLVLIQKGRGGGLINGLGAGGGNSLLGAKTAPVLTWVTSGAFVVFLVLSIVMNLIANHN